MIVIGEEGIIDDKGSYFLCGEKIIECWKS